MNLWYESTKDKVTRLFKTEPYNIVTVTAQKGTIWFLINAMTNKK